MKIGLALGFSCLAILSASACSTPDQFAVDIDITAGSSMLVADTTGKTPLQEMQSFVLLVSGDETESYTVAPGRAFADHERQRYFPATTTHTLVFTIEGRDTNGKTIATGASGAVALTPGHHTDTTITLQVPGFNPVDFAGEDLTGLDLSSVDLSGAPITTVSFVTPPSSPTANLPVDVASADFDGDGHPDVAIASKMDGKVQIFITGVGGVLPAAPKYTYVQAGASALGVGNFSGDTDIDFVVANAAAAGNIVFYTNTGGGFNATTPTTIGAGVDSIAVGDFDKDGKPDVAVGSSTVASAWIVYSSNGFATLTTMTLAHPASRLKAPDLNGDGYADLVAVETANNDVEYALSTSGTASYTFSATKSLAVTAPGDVAFADLNGDGKPDGIAVPNDSGTLATYLANARPGVLSVATTFSLDVGGVSHAVLADFDGDGKVDLLTTHQPGDVPYQALRLALGTGGAAFSTPVYYAFGDTPDGLIVEDLDGDGKLDVVVTSPGSNLVSTARGLGSSALYAGRMVMTPGQGGTFERPLIADVNADKKLDLLSTDRDATLVQLGDGMGNFATPVPISGGSTICTGVGDFNGDHILDIASGDFYGVVGVSLATGPGVFGPLTQTNEAMHIPDIVVDDLDGDGNVDIAVPDQSTTNLYVFRGTGTGALGTKEVYSVLINSTRILVADINGDGRKDLVTLSYGDSAGPGVSMLFGNVPGKFDTNQIFRVDVNYPFGLEIFDVNGDKIPDLIVGGDVVGYFNGNGDGTFVSTSTLLNQRSIGLVRTDVNRDGKLDLLASAQDGVHVFIGSAGTLVPAGVFLAGGGGNSQYLVAGDLTGDGLPELVTTIHPTAARIINNSH